MPTQTILEGKLLVILKTLTKKEVKKLRTYICSPFFNTNEHIICFFDCLIKHYPTFKKAKREDLFFKVYPDKQLYEDTIFRALMGDLTKLVKGFLTFQEYDKDWVYQKQKLLETFLTRRLRSFFEKEWKATMKKHQQTNKQDITFLWHEFQFRRLIDSYTVIYNNRQVEDSTKEAIDALDNYYVTNKLKYSTALLNQTKVLNIKHDVQLLEEVLNNFEQGTTASIPIAQVYYHLTLLLKKLTDTQFEITKKSLLNLISELPTDEVRHICSMLINYCIWQKLITKDKKYTLEIFELYKLMLDNNVLYVGNYISPHHFRNIVNVGLEVKDFDWVEGFIKFFKNKIHPSYEDNVYHFSLGLLHFAQRDYQNTARILAKIQFEFEFIDFYYHIDYKCLIVRNYYELDPTIEELQYALEAFRMYLRKNKIIKVNQRKAYNNFIRLTKKLINKKQGRKRTTRNLQEEITNTKPLAYGQWLLEKAKNL